MTTFRKLLLASALAASPLYAQAWNIICGVSLLSFKSTAMDSKWEADSAAIKAISEFYAGIAELQGVNVEFLTTAGAKKAAEVTRVSTATARFKSSTDQLSQAQAKAAQLVSSSGPADNMGNESIAMWKELAAKNTAIIKSLEGNQLPELELLHGAIDLTHRIGNLGMRASVLHLNQHKTHHTSGGAAAKF